MKLYWYSSSAVSGCRKQVSNRTILIYLINFWGFGYAGDRNEQRRNFSYGRRKTFGFGT